MPPAQGASQMTRVPSTRLMQKIRGLGETGVMSGARPALPASAADWFSHVTADKAEVYRAIMGAFATAKRQFRLHLRPDEVLAEAAWSGLAPPPEAVQAALDQLTTWGNLQAQIDTSRVSTLEEF